MKRSSSDGCRGQHPRSIAKALKYSVSDVEAVIDEAQDKSDGKHRLRGWQRDLERIDTIIARNVRDALDFRAAHTALASSGIRR